LDPHRHRPAAAPGGGRGPTPLRPGAGSLMRYAVGLPNVGVFGDPRLLADLAVAGEDAGWGACFIWDHLPYKEPDWPVATPTVVAAAIAARTSRIRFGVMVNAVARRRPGQLAA